MEEWWFDPFEEIRNFRRRMRRMWSFPEFEVPANFREPLADIIDEGAELVALVELPGVNKEDIQVNVTPTMLRIRVEKKKEKEEKETGYYYRERSYGGFYRAISLPTEVLPEQVKASYKNGVLEVRMKKKVKTTSEGREIKVE